MVLSSTQARPDPTEVHSAAPPEVQRRLLRSVLREERVSAGLTQKAAAAQVLWSLSKLIRIETGNVPISPADVRVLLLEYGASEERVAELVELAKSARRPDEWAAYRDVASAEALTLFANERAAQTIMKYEPSLIPGLFQTEAYAKALLAALGVAPIRANRIWQLRQRRQEILTGDRYPDLDFIIGEATVSRPVGGPKVMREQIKHLEELAGRENITLQLLPFSGGAHEGMGKAFTILQFTQTQLPDLLYLEDADKESISRDEEEEIKKYSDRFWDLKALAASADDLSDELDKIVSYRFTK
jgi:transcriptional regulator with XRE-family HTH domain